MMENELKVPTVAELLAKGETPDILFWVGCAGSFDERAQKITRDICRILQHVGLKYAILGEKKWKRISISNAGHDEHRSTQWL